MNAWHKLSITEAASLLATNVEHGLSVNEAKKRLDRYGQNKLRKGKRFSALVIFVSQFKSLVIWVLIGAAAVSAALGETVDGIAIIAIVILNAVIGFIQEYRDVKKEVPSKKVDVKEEKDKEKKEEKEKYVKIFWDEIWKNKDKTCIVITAADLRKAGLNIRKMSTFEQAADDFAASMKDERIQKLLECRHLVVLFDDLGVLHIANIDNVNLKKATFHFVPIIKDTEEVKKINCQPERFGTMVGNRLILMASILQGVAWSVRNNKPVVFDYLGQSITQGVGLFHWHLHDGFVLDKDKDKDKDGFVLDKDKVDYWRWPIMKLFKDEPDKKLLPVATIPVKLDHTTKEAPSKGAWGRVDIIYDQISDEDFQKILHEIVTLGLKEVAKKELPKE